MNKHLLGLQDISKARNFIYGFAIIWIMFFHCGLSPSTNFLTDIKSHGNCGVEIFFLLSGICLYYSYAKNKDTLEFYKRRAKRLFPPYIIIYGIVFICFDLIATFNIGQFLLDITMLDFWLHGLGRVPWFMNAIIVFYLLYPLIYKVIFNEKKTKKILGIITLILISITVIILIVKFAPHIRIFAARIPIFIIGCFAGKYVYENRSVKLWHILLLILLLIGTGVLFHFTPKIWWTRNLYYIFLSSSLVLLLSQIFKLFDRFAPFMNKPLMFLGTITLEIYLCHEKIQENLFKFLRWCGISVEFSTVWYQFLCIGLAIFVAFAVNRIVSLLVRVSRKSRQRATI